MECIYGQECIWVRSWTYDIKIFDKKKDRIWHAKNVIAMKDKNIFFLSETMLMRCMKRLREI